MSEQADPRQDETAMAGPLGAPPALDPKAPPGPHAVDVTCPSGLVVTMARMTVADLSELSKAARRDFLTRLCGVMNRCTQAVVDPGPYAVSPGPLVEGAWDWEDALTGDRLAAQLAHRSLSLGARGAEYRFEMTCQSCSRPFLSSVDLQTLPLVPYDPDVLATWRDKVPLRLTLPSNGRTVEFTLATGRTEGQAAMSGLKVSDRESLAQQLLPRIRRVEGIHDNERQRFLSRLDLEDADALTEAMDAVSGGVDTMVLVQCRNPVCKASQQVHLPFGEAAFYLPSTTQRMEAPARKAYIRRLTGRSQPGSP